MSTKKTIPNEARVLKEARALRAQGMFWKGISEKLNVGVSVEWFKRRLIPGYCNTKNRYDSRRNRRGEYASTRAEQAYLGRRPISDDELKQLRKATPADDRDNTGVLLGDPPSYRSALGRRVET